jgi:hypothetical protein
MAIDYKAAYHEQLRLYRALLKHQQGLASPRLLISWINDGPCRERADTAFTEGPERQIAHVFQSELLNERFAERKRVCEGRAEEKFIRETWELFKKFVIERKGKECDARASGVASGISIYSDSDDSSPSSASTG